MLDNAVQASYIAVSDCGERIKKMYRRTFLASSAAVAIAAYGRAYAAPKVYRIGWLTAQREPSLTPFLEAFRGGLAEFGYRENDNLEIDYRYGDDNLLRVAPLAAELARKTS